MSKVILKVERQVTLSVAVILEIKEIDCGALNTKYEAEQLARKHFGRNIRLEAYDGCYEIHDRGPVVSPAPSLIGMIWME